MEAINDYFHYRLTDEEGYLVPRGGATVCFSLQTINPGVFELFYSIARCSDKDNFCKRVGREVSGGRFLAHKFHGRLIMDLGETADTIQAKKAVLEFLQHHCDQEYDQRDFLQVQ